MAKSKAGAFCPRQTEQTYKPGSVSSFNRWMVTIYLVPQLPMGSSNQPEDLGRAASASSYLVLLLAGFAQPTGHPVAGELLPHLFTLTPIHIGAVQFLWHFP